MVVKIEKVSNPHVFSCDLNTNPILYINDSVNISVGTVNKKANFRRLGG